MHILIYKCRYPALIMEPRSAAGAGDSPEEAHMKNTQTIPAGPGTIRAAIGAFLILSFPVAAQFLRLLVEV